MSARAANPLHVDKATHDELALRYAGVEPVPVHIELDPGIDHEAIERELDEQLGLTQKPRRERTWDCLAGEAPIVCGHVRISRSTSAGLTDVVCLTCGHEYLEAG